MLEVIANTPDKYGMVQLEKVQIIGVRGAKYPQNATYFCEGKTPSGKWYIVLRKHNPKVKLPQFGGKHRNKYEWHRDGRRYRSVTDEMAI